MNAVLIYLQEPSLPFHKESLSIFTQSLNFNFKTPCKSGLVVRGMILFCYSHDFCLGFIRMVQFDGPLPHRLCWVTLTQKEFTSPFNFTSNLNFTHIVRHEVETPCGFRNYWQKSKEPEGSGHFSGIRLLLVWGISEKAWDYLFIRHPSRWNFLCNECP